MPSKTNEFTFQADMIRHPGANGWKRTALISAAVTGKIDVRNGQAPDPSEPQTEGVA